MNAGPGPRLPLNTAYPNLDAGFTQGVLGVVGSAAFWIAQQGHSLAATARIVELEDALAAAQAQIIDLQVQIRAQDDQSGDWAHESRDSPTT